MNLKSFHKNIHENLKALIKYVNVHTDSQKYAVIKEHLKKYKNKKMHKINLWCDQKEMHKKVINQIHKKCATNT